MDGHQKSARRLSTVHAHLGLERSAQLAAHCVSHKHKDISTALTYDDVLLIPKRSPVRSRRAVKMRTKLTKNIWINNPIVSSNMDTVTEDRMAIAMARNGGIGIIHRFLSVEDQARMVLRVKRAESWIIDKPYFTGPTTTVAQLKEMMDEKGVNSFLITDKQDKLLGIVSGRDLRFVDDDNALVEKIMTPRTALIVARPTVSLDEAKNIVAANKIKKLPLVDSDNVLRGLITSKDIINHIHRPYASLDSKGRLMVGAAVGVKDEIPRARALLEAGADVLVIDVAHGHSDLAIEALKRLKKTFPNVDIIAGNVATAEGTRELIEAGADGIKVGVGPGSICITRIVTGCGMPQLTAVIECAEVANKMGVPVMADGGIKSSGDITKAIAAGASTIMLGSTLAGTDESPGKTLIKGGKKVKVIRGMAGYGANMSKNERISGRDDIFDVVPEGVEAVVPYRGSVEGIIKQLVGGLASGISYCGGSCIEELQQNATFVRLTQAGKVESGSHDVDLI
eukprot:TRINITY_DN2055_c0_g1_i1.p1 TRINITY_DN2055_c0_g1~~TRINITY_DN2055_c0_g1_i1.p1  ORF type:complete len:524 (-),score=82.78 TRINITY_DN2055_c0_g1_i1:33-1562(-)